MRRLVVGLGILVLLVGLVWTLQGADVLMGSVMSGSSFWLAMGAVLLVVGLGVTAAGARTSGAKKAA